MLTIQSEKFENWYEEALPILKEHWHELCVDTSKMILNPHMETYLRLEENGNLMLLVARVKGEIVGYYIGFIVPSAHYRDTKCNIEDIFFIHPSRRGGRYAFELFAAVKEENKRRGVKFWKCTAKINTAAPKFLEKLGFKKFEECFYQWGE